MTSYRFGNTPDAYMRTPGTLTLLPNVVLTITDATTGTVVTGLKDKDGNTVTSVSTDAQGEYEFSCDSPVVMVATSSPARVWGPFYSPDAVSQVLTIMPNAAAIAAAAADSAAAAEAAQAAAEAAVAGGGGGSSGALLKTANLTDLISPTAARTALGLVPGTDVAAYNDGRFTSLSGAAATADAKAALAQTMAQEPVTYVATATATAGQKALATSARVLPASGGPGLAAALKTILETYKNIQFLGPVGGIVELDANLTATLQDGTIIDGGGIALRVHAGEANGGNSGAAGIILGGAAASAVTVTGFPTTIGQGVDTISHTSSAFATAVPAGTWCFITSTENRNPNRPLEFFKGEAVRTLSNSSTSWVISNPTRDSYTTSLATVRAVPMTTGVEIRNLSVISNPSGTSRQNGLVVRNVAGLRMSGIYVTGVEFADGVGIWGCVGYDVQGRSYMVQDRYGPGVQGYGLRLAGSEGGSIDWDGELDRHACDLGMSSSQWPVTRHTLVRRLRARYCYAAGFAIHDAEFTHTYEGAIQTLSCGGGIIVRGSYTRLLRPIVLGGQAVTYPWGAGGVAGGSGTQSTGAGISDGERTKLNTSAFDDTSANGYGGIGLEIIEPLIDLRGATGDFDGISIEDPLQGARIIVTTPIRCRRVGLRFMGDFIADSEIRVAVDHSTGTGGTGSYGPPSGTTYTGVTLTGSTGTFDLGSGTPPAVGTELISTGGTPASNTPAGWGGFVVGATYFVYSVSGTTFKVASRKSGNTAPITFTQDLTGLSFLTGQRVHSAYIVPSVSSVNQQYIRRSTIAITSTACRDTPVVIAGARNSGTSYRNTLNVTITNLGSGPTATTPAIRWVGTSVGEWAMGPVDATPHNRVALHAAYTGLTVAAGGPLVTYNDTGVRSRFLDGTASLTQARTSVTRQRAGSGAYHVRDGAGSITATALAAGDLGVVRAHPFRVIDRLIGGLGIGIGTPPVLSSGSYIRCRFAVFSDSNDGITPTVTKLADLGFVDITGATTNSTRTATLSTPLWDGAWDAAANGVWHLGVVWQTDGALSTYPTITFLSNVLGMAAPTDLLSNVSARGWSSTNTQVADAGSLGAVSGWSRDGSPRTYGGLLVDSTTMGGLS